ncbi:hypothetical protein Asi03nite_29110 [Actinoplanes siamensis]|uniref:Uncharacterized protein n=1 Tax=Actinoplanes siamensis TaxID=1223317 RepID=A0A919N6P6_9ACTN|nr:hypothetical protein Asi03nite_29110 [Actinoplanes siamensis]
MDAAQRTYRGDHPRTPGRAEAGLAIPAGTSSPTGAGDARSGKETLASGADAYSGKRPLQESATTAGPEEEPAADGNTAHRAKNVNRAPAATGSRFPTPPPYPPGGGGVTCLRGHAPQAAATPQPCTKTRHTPARRCHTTSKHDTPPHPRRPRSPLPGTGALALGGRPASAAGDT